MHRLALIAISALLLTACDNSAARATNDAKLQMAIRDVMCSDRQDDRAHALSRVVELALIAVPEETRQSVITESATEIDCGAPMAPAG